MIISKSPFRISFFGGSTDYEEWFSKNGGAFISLAFQKYSYSLVKRLPKNSNKKYDNNGELATIGKKNEIILEQAQELYRNRFNKEKKSFDTGDFDISFSRGLSLEDGSATLTEFTASILADSLIEIYKEEISLKEILICGGGRKNKVLINSIIKNLTPKVNLKSIDEYGIDGDFVESQAFAFLAIRSYKKLPITFPTTTNCKQPTLGGELIEN